jgi:hypothetical protein
VAWFKVDDKFHSSEEVMSIPLAERAAAIGLWTLAGAWSADQLKDGYVPVTHLETWGGTIEIATSLVRAKLWTRVGSRGFQFRNWDKWQTTRADVDERQSGWREKKAAERARKAVKTGAGLDGVSSDMLGSPAPVPSIPSRPVPTRPVPSDLTTDTTHDVLSSTEIPVRDEHETQELLSAAQSLGIKNLPRIAMALNRAGVVVDAAECIDVTRAILDLSTEHVRYPEKYIETACEKPDDVRAIAADVLARSPRAVLGGVA